MKSNLPESFQNLMVNDKNKINGSLRNIMDNYEKEVLINLIKEHGDTAESKVKIAKILKINLATLYRKLNKYDIKQ